MSVLIVDDEPSICELAKAVLFPAGYEVMCCKDGREALELLEAGARPRLILLDLVMPVMDGPALLAEIRHRGWDMPVVLVSAHLSPGQELGAPVVGKLEKPFASADLLTAVIKVIGTRPAR